MPRILIIEDDAAIVRGLTDALEAEFFTVTAKRDGLQGLIAAQSGNYDCIIIDMILSSMSGREICKALHEEGIATPILMLVGKGEETDIILGLEVGADDYITKPFSIRELIARIRGLLRKTVSKESPKTTDESNKLRFGNVVINFKKRVATVLDKKIHLSTKESDILQFFGTHEGVAVTREMLLNAVWGYEHFPTSRTVDNYILALQKKLESNPAKPKHIITLHNNVGYKFMVG